MAETFRKSKVNKLVEKLKMRKEIAIDNNSFTSEKAPMSYHDGFYNGQLNMLNKVLEDIDEIFNLSEAH
ncbi:hypothetical protein HPT25_27050 [Bacillus sp. BRMEA1]|uniref:hypothetical protein n=1 Tax=Neobacillus endophyticus TaxID=2738405 RepID=UPI0015678EDB|nr:hypothetical protein [Neobacillus endophyticus]NRD80984.1 hypothetical protein [Neobacillus endophyticus]